MNRELPVFWSEAATSGSPAPYLYGDFLISSQAVSQLTAWRDAAIASGTSQRLWMSIVGTGMVLYPEWSDFNSKGKAESCGCRQEPS